MSERAQQITGDWGESADISPAISRTTLTLKRVLDLVVATLSLVIAVPITLLVALATRMDTPGPVFFRQERIGLRGVPFQILKFRTMYHEVGDDLHKDHVNNLVCGSGQAPLSLRLEHDHRITPVGRFLRKWSLDELPNLWNVFKGDMSVVGPRPLVPYEIDALGPAASKRLAVKPGVTGLAQVNGRLDHDVDTRTDHDIEYVEKLSVLTDCAVLIKTPGALLRRRGI